MVRGSSRFRSFLFVAVFGIVVYFGRSLWLPWLASPLIHDDGPAQAELIVVLAGDARGYRIEKASSLVKEGYAPRILVSGPPIYATHESDLAIAMAVKKGNPPEWFIPFPHSALSTREEADMTVAELGRRGVRSFLLVTSNYHTARARRLFQSVLKAQGGRISMRVVASPDHYFQENSWWTNREGQKTVFFEWSKGLANAVGM